MANVLVWCNDIWCNCKQGQIWQTFFNSTCKVDWCIYWWQGRKHGKIGDDYDFKKRADTLKNIPNNHGYSLQEKGALENYFTVMDVIIEDDDWLDKLRRKLGL